LADVISAAIANDESFAVPRNRPAGFRGGIGEADTFGPFIPRLKPCFSRLQQEDFPGLRHLKRIENCGCWLQ
jgi:hypothetical protein